MAAIALLLAPVGLLAQSSPSAILTRAHEMHEALVRKPLSQRRAQDYRQIAGMLESVWNGAHQSDMGQEAEYEAGSIYVSLARDLRVRSAWLAAQQHFAELLKQAPFSIYRRNTEWALSQVEINHLNQRGNAIAWLRDFVRRYPADPRVEIAHQELRGLHVPNAPILSTRINGPLPLPLARAPEHAARTAPPQHAARPEPVREKSVARPAATPVPMALIGRTREVIFSPAGVHPRSGLDVVLGLHVRTAPGLTSVIVDLSHPVRVVRGYLPANRRYYYDLHDSEMGALATSGAIQKMDVEDGRILQVHIGQNRKHVVRLVIDAASASVHVDDPTILTGPARLQILVRDREAPAGRRLPPHPPAGLNLARNTPPPAAPAPHRVTKSVSVAPAARDAISHPAGRRENQDLDASAREEMGRTTLSSSPAVHHPQPTEAAARTPAPPAARSSAPSRKIASSAAHPAPLHAAPASTRTVTTADLNTPPAATAVTHHLYTDRGDPPTRTGARSLTRVLGLKIHKIVLDAGHGGHDTGTIGPGNIYEKDVVLDVVLRLGRLLHDRLGMDVVYTRKTDVFIPLQERTAIANAAHADLFLSVHANSSDDPHVRGIETYYLDFTHNPRALAVAARENATSQLSIHSLQTLVQKIAINDKQEESREFAGDLLTSLVHTTHVEDRGVKSAPFVVLIGAQMPSVLAEISFLSDPTDAHLLREGRYRQRIADALYRGVLRYIDSLNGVHELRPHAVETMVEKSGHARRGLVRPVADRKP